MQGDARGKMLETSFKVKDYEQRIVSTAKMFVNSFFLAEIREMKRGLFNLDI